MNQIKKRLSIINLAISMTDDETIRDQIDKLKSLKSDENLQKILSLLRSQQYGQAQRHIQTYLDSKEQVVIQRIPQVEEPHVDTKNKSESIISKKDQDIIEQFDLFITTPEVEEKPIEEKEDVKIDDFFSSLPPQKEKTMPSVDFNALLNINMDNVMINNIELDDSNTSCDTFLKDIKKDDFFNHDAIEEKVEEKKEELSIQIPDTKTPPMIPMDDISVSKVIEPISFDSIDIKKEVLVESIKIEEEAFEDDLPPPLPIMKKENKTTKRPVINYKNISYIDDKFTSMQNRYPSLENNDDIFTSVTLLAKKIREDGYTEEEIEETLDYIDIIKKEGNQSEAAKLLLLCASTESKFGQFILARELFKGQIVVKNMSESFSMMNSLALEGFPEAMCDLGQFYENGLGIYKDVKKAGYLYKEAMEHGIVRAQNNYQRISQQYNKLFK
jgi:hypothetical protein